MIVGKVINKGKIAAGLQEFQDRLDGKRGSLLKDLGKLESQAIAENVTAGGIEPTWPSRKREPFWPIENKTGEMMNRARDTALGPWKVETHMGKTVRFLQVFSRYYGYYQGYGVKQNNLPARDFFSPSNTRHQEMIQRIRKEWTDTWQV